MSFAKLFPPKASHAREEHWIPLADLMTGLMMVFMLVAVVFMVKVEAESARAEELKREAHGRRH